jgi:hypothetical protein
MATATAAEYATRMLENDYVQDKLREAGAKFGDARKRASKRRVNPATDSRVQAQVGDAVLALKEAAAALQDDRTGPAPSWRKRLVLVGGVAAAAAAAALAASDELRAKLLGDGEHESSAPSASPVPETTPTAG